jgi:hypothetical protein
MAPFLHKLFRGAVFGLMLLLAGSANLVCLSFDADDNEDTPPVNVELNIVAPCKKAIQAPKLHSVATASLHSSELPVAPKPASSIFAAPILLDQESPQLQVPLRT